MTSEIEVGDGYVLLVIDVQVDFCPGGRLAVPSGDEVVPLINLIAGRFKHVVLTQDWHTQDHECFASAHPGRKPFESVTLSYGTQVLWPDHCVQGSRGAEFHPSLHVPHAGLILRKGFRPAIDSYSAFFENDRRTPTGLGGYLRERGLTRVFLAGLAFDFCVRYSAEDAAGAGLTTTVIVDACRGLGPGGSIAATHRSLSALGVVSVNSDVLLRSK